MLKELLHNLSTVAFLHNIIFLKVICQPFLTRFLGKLLIWFATKSLNRYTILYLSCARCKQNHY